MSDLRPARERRGHRDQPLPRAEARRLRIAVVSETPPRGHLERTSTGAGTGTGHLLAHLHRRGHDTVLICPLPRRGASDLGAAGSVAGAPVVPVPSMSLRGHPVGLPSREVMRALAAFAPDVVHLDFPLLLGAAATAAAAQLGVPTVAVREARPGPSSLLGRTLARRVLAADLTLELGPDLFSPRRGVAAGRLRRDWAPDGGVVVGYWGTEPVQVAGTVGIRLDPGATSGSARDAGSPSVLAALDLLVVGGPTTVAADGEVPAARELLVERALASGVPVIAPADSADSAESADSVGSADLIRPGLDGLAYTDGVDLARCVHALATDAHRRHWAGMAAASGAERRARERFGDELITRYREVIGLGNR